MKTGRAWLGRYAWLPQPRPGNHPASARKFKLWNIGCWNIRTVIHLEANRIHPKRRSAFVPKIGAAI